MGWPSRWMRRMRRWAAMGLAGGLVAAASAGCRSTESVPAPHPLSGLFPRLFGTEETPLLADENRDALVRHAHAVANESTSDSIAPAPLIRGETDGAKAPGSTEVSALPGEDGLTGSAMPPRPEETLDLGIALRLAGVSNPTIQLAQEQIREAVAAQLAARALLLPSVNIGGNYHWHDGALQASFGGMRIVKSQSLYLGFGARTLAAETLAFPGIRLFAHLGDAVYEPLAARQQVAVRNAAAQAVQNNLLGDVATAYMELIGAESLVSLLQKSEQELAEIARLTEVFAQKGQGREGDANRAKSHLELLRREILEAQGEVNVASARLCRLLNLDPTVRLRTPGGAVLAFRLIPENAEQEALVIQATSSRPELFSQTAAIQQAQVRIRQEKTRPFLPLVSIGYSGGFFGGGSNQVSSQFGPLGARTDLDVMAIWTMQNMMVGNRARVRSADAVMGQAVAEYDRLVNEIRAEVSEALADVKSAARQIELSRRAVVVAEEGYKLEMQRIRAGGPKLGLPIEVLDSYDLLLTAQKEYLRAIIDFDITQFRLFVATGSNPLTAPNVEPQEERGAADKQKQDEKSKDGPK